MKQFLSILILGLFLAPTIQAADKAPDFSLPGSKGTVSLASFKGKVVYVDFWASWCTPCRKSFPWMNEMQSRYGSKGLAIVAINLDQKRSIAEEFLKETPASFTIAFDPDGTSAERYNVKGMPSSYLIDRQGNIIASHIGFRTDSAAKIEDEIKGALR